MRHRPAPTPATWLLKLFCSGAEYEAVTGDLSEQYQRGRGRFWYWRQVITIVFLALYGKTVRRPLVPTSSAPIRQGTAVILVIVGVSVVLLSDIWPLLVPVIVGAAIAGILHALRGDGSTEPATFDAPAPARIESSRIPVSGGIGVGHREKEIPMRVHRGINSANVAGEGLEGLPGLLIAVGFVFMFFSIFLPRNRDWPMVVFVAAETGAAALYFLVARRNRKDSEELKRVMHRINEQQPR